MAVAAPQPSHIPNDDMKGWKDENLFNTIWFDLKTFNLTQCIHIL